MILGTQPRWVRPGMILVAMLVFILVFRQRTAPLRLASPQAFESFAVSQPTIVVQPPISSSGSSSRLMTALTTNTRIYTGVGATYSDDVVATMAEPVEAAIGYVSERTGYTLSQPVNIMFDSRPGGCSLDAAAYTNVRTIFMYACADIPQTRAINILSHEIVHQLAQDRYGAAHMQADLILSEGVATWGAGRYWLGGASSFHDFVATNYRGALLPLATDSRGASTATMNQLYYQWASFVEWIKATYGEDAFDRLYSGGVGRNPGTAPYAEVLGIDLPTTELAWQTWIDRPQP